MPSIRFGNQMAKLAVKAPASSRPKRFAGRKQINIMLVTSFYVIGIVPYYFIPHG
jgi:hypothetical protein